MAGSSRRVGSICFVTADFAGVVRNGGIGTHFWLMSRLLARRGWTVHVVFCGSADDQERLREAPEMLAREGVAFHLLEDLPAPPGWGVPHFGGDDECVVLGEHVLEALEELHSEHRFDLIEFPDWRALGLRAVQAKVCGDALDDVPLAVKLHSTSQWQREGNLQYRSAPRDLKLEFCERYAFEHADVQLSPSRYMLEYTRLANWAVREDAVVAYPYPDPESEATPQVSEIRELVFFGRLERRKGLHLFLDALDSVAPEMPALFLGKDTLIGGDKASEVIGARLGDRPHRIETELDREGALTELRRGDRLAVIPSISETFGFTVAECVTNRIPFLAARAGGIPEVVDHSVARDRWLFDPTSEGLRDALVCRLEAPDAGEVGLRAEVASACNPDRWNDGVEGIYRNIAQPSSATPVARVRKTATVTVAVSHFNHERFLPSALGSLASQVHSPDEVIVIDDGSTSEEAGDVFAEMKTRYSEWTFLRQENSGPGVARNRALERAAGDYFLPFDSDNIARPDLVGRLLEAMLSNPSRDVTTCHYLAFVENEDIDVGKFAFRYSPTGGPRLSGCLENVYGDTCALFRAEALRKIGGFECHRWSPYEDWETFVKMAVRGFEVGVLPRPLFYYRTDSGGRLQTLTADPAVAFRHRRYLIEEFFAEAELTQRERRDLWECLLGFEGFVVGGVEERLRQQRMWHDSQMEDLHAWRLSQLEEQRVHLDAQRHRADVAEAELAALTGITPKRVLRRVWGATRRRISNSQG